MSRLNCRERFNMSREWHVKLCNIIYPILNKKNIDSIKIIIVHKKVLNHIFFIEQKYRVYNIATFYMPYTGFYGSVEKTTGYTSVTCYSVYD